jgi:ferredoxin
MSPVEQREREEKILSVNQSECTECQSCTRTFDTPGGMRWHHRLTHNAKIVYRSKCKNPECAQVAYLDSVEVQIIDTEYCSTSCREDHNPTTGSQPGHKESTNPIVLVNATQGLDDGKYHTDLKCGYIKASSWVRERVVVDQHGFDECENCKRLRTND